MEGIDIGIGTTAANNIKATQRKKRIDAAKKRSMGTAILAAKNRKVKRIANTGPALAHHYGHTVYGMPPTDLSRCRENIAKTTDDKHHGTCSTTTLAWHVYDSKSVCDPAIRLSTKQIKTWLRLYRSLDDSNRRTITKRWCSTYARMSRHRYKWALVRGPIAATIATILDMGWKPLSPTSG